MAITFNKLAEILAACMRERCNGQVLVSATGEISLMFFSQPSKVLHDYLKRKGFRDGQMDGTYVYRP